MKYWPSKTPAGVRNLGLDWGPTLSKLNNAIIVDSDWTRLRGDALWMNAQISEDGQKVWATIHGGTAGVETVFRNQIELSTGQILDEDVFIRIRA